MTAVVTIEHTRWSGTVRSWRDRFGRLHREGGPAVESQNGYKEWYWHGTLHRADGPAEEDGDARQWKWMGLCHRLGRNPASERTFDFGTEFEWYRYGQKHRFGGPAMMGPKVTGWFHYGARHRRKGPAIIDDDGGFRWYLRDELHRDDGPAVYQPFMGRKEWWLHGRKHRDDGPAIQDKDGYEEWYVDGCLHREDGPAIVRPAHCNLRVGRRPPRAFYAYYWRGERLIKAEWERRKARGP